MADDYRPKKSLRAYLPDFDLDSDLDWTSPYPCGVCGRAFQSRWELAHHPHPKKKEARRRDLV